MLSRHKLGIIFQNNMSEDWSSIVSKMVKSSFLHKLISLNENQSYQDSDESYHTKMSNFGTF